MRSASTAITLALFTTCALAIGAISYTSVKNYKELAASHVYDRLISQARHSKSLIEINYDSISKTLKSLDSESSISQAASDFEEAIYLVDHNMGVALFSIRERLQKSVFDDSENANNQTFSLYNQVNKRYRQYFSQLFHNLPMEDILLIDPSTSYVIFSQNKESKLGLMATSSKIQKSPLGLAYNRAMGGNAGDPSFSGFVLDDSTNKAISYIVKTLPGPEGDSLILAVKFNPDIFSDPISKRLLSDAGISTRLATRTISDLVSVGQKFDGNSETPRGVGIFQRHTPAQSKIIGAAYIISFMGEDIYVIAEAPMADTTSGSLKLALAASSIPAILFSIVALFFFRSRLIGPLDALRVSLKSVSASGVLDRVSPPTSGFEELFAISNLIKDLAHRLESQDNDEGSELKSLNKLTDTLMERIEALEGELELRDECYAETRSQLFELVEVVKRQDNKLAHNGRKLDIAHKIMREMDDTYELFLGAAQRELINSTHSLISMVRQADNSANYPMSGAILDKAKRLQRSVEKAVANLSLDSDYKSFPFEELNLLDLAKEVLAGFADRAERKGISLDLKARDGDWNIMAGLEYIRFVIENLIENAMDHSGDNRSVSLSLSQAQDSIRVEVSDSGAGLEADEIRQVFHRFKKMKSGDSENSAGMGLGLYLCRVIIQRHDGSISSHSEPGVGSSFFFEIPREPGHNQESLPGLIQNPDQ